MYCPARGPRNLTPQRVMSDDLIIITIKLVMIEALSIIHIG